MLGGRQGGGVCRVGFDQHRLVRLGVLRPCLGLRGLQRLVVAGLCPAQHCLVLAGGSVQRVGPSLGRLAQGQILRGQQVAEPLGPALCRCPYGVGAGGSGGAHRTCRCRRFLPGRRRGPDSLVSDRGRRTHRLLVGSHRVSGYWASSHAAERRSGLAAVHDGLPRFFHDL